MLPLFLSNKDVCVKACTGSGKTLAFIVPIIERLLRIVNEFKSEVGSEEDKRLPPNKVVSIIIAPSRELVIQIYNVLCEFRELFKVEKEQLPEEVTDAAGDQNPEKKEENSKEKEQEAFWANFSYFIGGDKLEFDLQRIQKRGANVVVATPGRLFDLIERNTLDLKKMEVMIVDEADKVLAEGSNEIKMQYILDKFPKQRRTGLFSATMPT